MTDQAALLNQLRIERVEPAAAAAPRGARGDAGAAAVVIAAAAFAAARPDRCAGRTVAAGRCRSRGTPPSLDPSAAAAPGASILDASGYVVARRQATVSSKITGKVVAVLIEEGQRVEAGEVIARLDDTNTRAQVAQAAAQVEQQRANLTAAQVAFANAVPTFDRNRAQFAARFISAQAFDRPRLATTLRRRRCTSRYARSRLPRRASPSRSATSTTPSSARRSPAS